MSHYCKTECKPTHQISVDRVQRRQSHSGSTINPLLLVSLVTGLLLAGCALNAPVETTAPTPDQTHSSQRVTLVQPDSIKAMPALSSNAGASRLAQTHPPSHHTHSQTDAFSSALYLNIWDRLRDHYAFEPQAHLSSKGHQRISSFRDRYLKQKHFLQKILQRSQRYLYYITSELEARQMPGELALLPVIESAYDPFAYSSGRAAGLWQFIPGTGKLYGLKQNWWYDGRRDIIDSTEAALAYLNYLQRRFDGDWLLALAAYNAGSGTVHKAIQRNRRAGKPTDFWSLKLPKETQQYVPKLLAVAEIIRTPHKYHFTPTPIPNKPTFAIIPTGGQIALSEAAKMAKLDTKQLYAFNPGFNRGITSPDGPHRLLIPIEHTAYFINALSGYAVEERTLWHHYRVQRGDNLTTIAKRHQANIEDIRQVNNIKRDQIFERQTLLIPKSRRAEAQLSTPAQSATHSANTQANRSETYLSQLSTTLEPLSPSLAKKKVHYRVRSGESLSTIAHKFKISIANIAQWNDLDLRDLIHPGQPLKLFIDTRHNN